MGENCFQDVTTLQEILLAGVEKNALAWLALGTPSFVNMDRLTLAVQLAMAGTGCSARATTVAGDLAKELIGSECQQR